LPDMTAEVELQEAAPSSTRAAATVRPKRRRRAWIAGAFLLAGAVIYFGFGWFVAYTEDAYIQSDLVAVAPEVAAVVDQHQSLGRARRGDTLYVAVPAGPLVVRLAYSLNGVPAAVHVLRRGIVLASLLSLIVATLLAAWLAQRAAKRLARIVVFANRIAAGDLSARVEEGNLDEISAVAHALDVTASRLEHSFHALESSRSELTALLDSMQEAVIAINPQGQVSWCNAVMQRIALTPVQEGRALVHSVRDPEVLSSVAAALTQRQASRRRPRTCLQSDPGTFGFAWLATLWVVLELFVEEKELFPSGEDKFAATICTG